MLALAAIGGSALAWDPKSAPTSAPTDDHAAQAGAATTTGPTAVVPAPATDTGPSTGSTAPTTVALKAPAPAAGAGAEPTPEAAAPSSSPEPQAASGRASPRGRASPDDPVDLNTAKADDLRRLPGVGAKRAEAILALRARLGGRFRQLEDLLKVKGIGRAMLRRLHPLVRVAVSDEDRARAAGGERANA